MSPGSSPYAAAYSAISSSGGGSAWFSPRVHASGSAKVMIQPRSLSVAPTPHSSQSMTASSRPSWL